ncbi:MAG: DUF4975 domain-containing protein [Anaerolineales bacterium]|nr:DUF4975 domain-containing protein [Anaerolineales bacterium]
MLLAARQPGGPSRRRGCTALCASADLHTWEVRAPFWAPRLYFTHECPDLFRLGDWWYLLFSEFSEANLTRYRMSRSLAGPWLTPPDDAFDGRAFYAAKTASDGAHRYLFGWCASREGERDDGRWQWGGNLVVHELTARADGTLAVRPPEGVVAAFHQPVELAPEQKPALGEPCDHAICLTAPGSFVCEPVGPQPTCGKLTVTVHAQEHTRGCGLALCLSDDLEKGYYIRVEPQQQRLVFDLWPRPGDRPFVTGIERPLAVTPGEPLTLTVLLDGSVCVVYAGGQVALCARLYDLQQANARRWGVFVQQGAAEFDALGAWTLG